MRVRCTIRKTHASYIVEAVIVPYVLLFLIALPVVNFVTCTMRCTFLWTCARDASFHAAKAKSFVSDVSATSLSAKNIARQIVTIDASGFNGVSIDSVDTCAVITDLDTKAVTRQTNVLTTAPDTDKCIYQTEVVVTGKVRPLLLFSQKVFGSIPGISDWIQISVRSKDVCESPQGLML